MKKVKIMLTSIAVLAVFAGVFAFKAKNAFNFNLLYTTATTYVGQTCKITATSTTLDPIIPTSYYYTTQNLGATTDPCLSYRTTITFGL